MSQLIAITASNHDNHINGFLDKMVQCANL